MKYRRNPRMNRYANLATPSREVKSVSPRRKQKKNRFGWFGRLSLWKKILVVSAPVLVLLILIPVFTYIKYANDISDQERLMNRNNTGIVLTDINGKAFYSVGRAQHRTIVPLSDISGDLKDALIASEDKDFYKHSGFSILSIFRAAFTGVGGGSTITQQLAKNTLLSDEHSYLRKYQELAISVAIEQRYSKDEILNMYLNSVYFGENAFGIEEAADTYFGKKPKDLDLAESSMLIGLLPAPSAYSPISGSAEYAKQRQKTVLTRMVNNGYITSEELSAATSQELVYADGASSIDSIAPHFAEMVINELSKKYGYEKVMRSGSQVQTTLDSAAQNTLNESISGHMGYIQSRGGSNASGVIVDPKTGQIRALVGSADYDNKEWGKVNMVTTARQPGSSFKPIYYSYALADGVVTPATILKDKPTDFGGYKPLNADRQFRGDISLRRAISQSLNIPSVEVMQSYGVDKSINAAHQLGITAIKSDADYGLSLALGTAEAPLVQMTSAYATFADGGLYHSSRIIVEVKDKFDKTIETIRTDSKQAISRQGAYLISSILSDNAARAPIFGNSLTIPGHTVAVKTGTTDDSRDAWTIGYTPTYAVGVWVGNNNNDIMRSGGSDMAGPIWKAVFNKLLAGSSDEKFAIPDGVVQRDVCTSNGGLASKAGDGTYREYFQAGALPTNTCNVATKIEVCNLDTKKIETIDDTDFDDSKYSKSTDDCKVVKVKVCELESGKIIEINESEYSTTMYSKDTKNCKPKDEGTVTDPDMVTVCNLETGRIEEVPVGYDEMLYATSFTTNGNSCTPTASGNSGGSSGGVPVTPQQMPAPTTGVL